MNEKPYSKCIIQKEKQELLFRKQENKNLNSKSKSNSNQTHLIVDNYYSKQHTNIAW